MSLRRSTDEYASESRAGRTILVLALSLIPLAAITGVAIDYGMSFIMREKLDAVAESALASALAQSRSLRDLRSDVTVDEMELKGRSRADLVFNAQKPNLRDIRTTFTLARQGAANVFDARVTYSASHNTVFLRFVGVKELEIGGGAATVWVARDALIDEKFEGLGGEVIAAGRKVVPASSGWLSSGRSRIGGASVLQLASAASYTGPPPPADVKVALELDTADGNVAISRKISLEPGPHQLRYWYKDRAENEHVGAAWLCGTREEDVAWMSARDRSAAGDTNRMSVFLSLDAGGARPESSALDAATRLDACYSSGHRWIQRTVKIDILNRGDYWLTFRGEGRPDGDGAAVGNILFCREPCADDGELPPPLSNYPWRPGNLLFEDRFAAAEGGEGAPAGSDGASRLASGWAIWPPKPPAPGRIEPSGFVELDGPSGGAPVNQRMSRPFLFTPGFYQLRYTFAVGPNSPHKAVSCNYFGVEAALQRIARVVGADTHRINVVIDPDRPYLHPEKVAGAEPRIEWFAADRSPESASPKRPHLPDMSNAVDFCAGAPPNVAANREINFRIDKAGYYWITFAAEGPADGEGGRIGAVQVFALGQTYPGQGIPRIIRSAERGDAVTPPVGSMLIQPPGSAGQRALYRVTVQ